MILFWSLIAILSGLTVVILWRRKQFYYLSWQLPGPFAWPIVGNGLSFMKVESARCVIQSLIDM